MNELKRRNLRQGALAHWDEHFEAFPALDCQARIFALAEKLWRQRDEIVTQFSQMAPLEYPYSEYKAKDQVINKLLDFVKQHTCIFKKD